MFNTLKYAKILQEVGFSREQAETSIKLLEEVMEEKLASKQDLKDFGALMHSDFRQYKTEMRSEFEQFKTEMRSEFEQFKTEMRGEFEQFKTEMRSEFAQFKSEMHHLILQSENRLTIRMGGMIAAAVAIISALQRIH